MNNKILEQFNTFVQLCIEICTFFHHQPSNMQHCFFWSFLECILGKRIIWLFFLLWFGQVKFPPPKTIYRFPFSLGQNIQAMGIFVILQKWAEKNKFLPEDIFSKLLPFWKNWTLFRFTLKGCLNLCVLKVFPTSFFLSTNWIFSIYWIYLLVRAYWYGKKKLLKIYLSFDQNRLKLLMVNSN